MMRRLDLCACVTIGELEIAAGIQRDNASRFAFWQPFVSLGDAAFAAAVDDLHRRISDAQSGFRLPSEKKRRSSRA